MNNKQKYEKLCKAKKHYQIMIANLKAMGKREQAREMVKNKIRVCKQIKELRENINGEQ